MARAAARTRVAIVDDHALVAEGVAALLREEPDLEVVGMARDVEAAAALIERAGPDVVVCDVQLGAASGFSLLGRWPAGRPAFVMFSGHDHASYRRAAREAGAAAFVLKSGDSADLRAAVRAAARGERLASGATSSAARSTDAVPTERELEIIEHIAAGRSNDAIAAALGIRPKTVEGHLRAVFDRVGVASRTELILRAIEEGWIRLEPAAVGDGQGSAPGRPVPRRASQWVADREALRARYRPGPPGER